VLQSFQLQGALPPEPLTGGSAPCTPNGVSAPDPYIGSCSCARHHLWCMCNGACKILWRRARQSHNQAVDVAMVWSSLWVTGLRALGAKSVIYDCLVTIAPIGSDLCPPAAPLMSESWRRPCLDLGKTDPHARAASLAQLVLALEPSPRPCRGQC